jgi:hypothetical protein
MFFVWPGNLGIDSRLKTENLQFCPLLDSSQQAETKEEDNADTLKSFAGILGNS